MVVFAGQGDARRSMALLWRAESPAGARTRRWPGPKPALSVAAIVDAGVAVADADGMAALSMRAVGERLGRTAMALYTYVPGKSELVDLMYDQVLAELPTDYDLTPGWRAAVTSWAEDTWEFYLRHPWVLQVSQARPVLGPNEYRALETLLRLLYATELSSAVLRRVVGALFHFIRGAAQTVTESRQAAASTGVSDEEWWQARSGLLTEMVPDFAERFPLLVRLETEGAAPDPGDAVPYMEREARSTFDIGLAVILDGIDAAIQQGR
ncbi:TetR/AcrR family transcriptional regulator [Streptomyces sp. RPA4-5]|uniref:TetR/AcrR family transcriptional regulator n=1 Tax=Streptomyces TaxID=1883 RepID=UPI00143E6EEF|nr:MULTISPECIES: TetR/AcrR family transcriptional regulator C-terminal domain-containing protein [Streptomyces]MCX4637184.1 TetR/AcrR family transcriptional regulator [Streptomyces platensis]QIY54075.1 TetR/AcrR family transcriptional regulator [Streptomyces sp. RPA4-5]